MKSFAGEDVWEYIDTHNLYVLGTDIKDWGAWYADPVTDELFSLRYPNSDYHGGGDPELTQITYKKRVGRPS